MHVGSWESTREAFEWHKAKLGASLASRASYNSIYAQLMHGPFR